jgi:hypothetical protein
VINVPDSGTRGYGSSRVVIDAGKIFWTRDKDGKLSISAAELTGPLPAQAKLLLEAPFAAQSGWSNPPLLPTTGHLIFPAIGVIDVGEGLVESRGWAVMRKDGSGLRLDVLENWWIVARGDSVVYSTFYDGSFSYAPTTGASSPLADVPRLGHSATCVYDATADEIGCLEYGIVAYDFKSAMSREISSNIAIKAPQFGSIRLAFNRRHWFAPVTLPSGGGIGAFSRDDGGSVQFLERVDALGAVIADDEHLYACLAGALTRISLADGARVVLTEDCGDAHGMSLLAADTAHIYYVQTPKSDAFYPRVFGDTLTIHRVAKARP